MEEGAAAVCVNSRALLTQLHTELSAETSTVISAAHSSFYTLLLPLLLSLSWSVLALPSPVTCTNVRVDLYVRVRWFKLYMRTFGWLYVRARVCVCLSLCVYVWWSTCLYVFNTCDWPYQPWVIMSLHTSHFAHWLVFLPICTAG